MQPCEFYDEANKLVGPKKVAAVHGIGVQQAYKIAQPEEAGGSRTDLDRFLLFVDMLGAYPSARPMLKRMRLYIDAQFARVLDGETVPLTELDFVREGAVVLKEVSEFLAELDEPERMNLMKAVREGSEAAQAVEGLLRRIMAISSQQHDSGIRRMR